MASKPTVTLTFAGDSDKLSRAFKDVGDSADQMSRKVRDIDEPIRNSSSSLDNLGEKADGAEGKAIGFTDTISGLQGAFEGITDPTLSFGERLAVVGQATADLAGGMASFLIPAISGMWKRMVQSTAATWAISAAQTAWAAVTKGVTAATAALNAVMRANPILFVVGLIAVLVGAFLALWTRSAGFRNFFIGMWRGIQNVVGGVVNWIKGAWNGVASFFSNLPSRIGRALGSIGGVFKSAFRGAANLAIDAVNWMIDRINDMIYGVNLINPFSDIPSIPKLSRMHTGGVVPGMLGSEQMAILQAGERVVPRGQQGNGGSTVTFAGDTDSAFARAFMKLVRTGDIQIG